MHNSYWGGTFLNSCSKEENTPLNATNTVEKNTNDLQMAEQIEQFHAELLGNRKSYKSMHFEDALFLMEATFNYYHSFPDEDFTYTKTDSIYLPTKHKLDDELTNNSLSEIYTEINNSLYYALENFEAENKYCILFDFELITTAEGNKLLLIQTIGELNMLKSANAGIDPFSSTDYWLVGISMSNADLGNVRPGKCGDFEGQYLGQDHTTQLERSARTFYNSHKGASLKSTKAKTTIYYYTDVETHWIEDWQDLHVGPEDDCISPSEMNNYHHIVCEKIENTEINYGGFKEFTGTCQIENLWFSNDYGLFTTLLNASFGIKHIREIEPIDMIPIPQN